jgi:hypothetical protein
MKNKGLLQKRYRGDWAQWLIPIILATKEEEIRRILV